MKSLSWRHSKTGSESAAISGASAKVTTRAAALPSNVAGPMSSILRPQAAYRWMLPQLAAITPQYIEMTLRGALAGNHVQAWELFDLMEDSWPHLGHCIQQIKRAVANLTLSFDAYRDEDEEPTPSALEKMRLCSAAWRGLKPDACADENGERGTVFDLLDAWFKGVVVLETDWQSASTRKLGKYIAPRATRWVHPTCYAWSMEGRIGLRADAQGRLSPGNLANTSYQPMASSVADFPPDKFLIGIAKAKSGSPLGGALLRPLAWWWCASNFSADWLLNLAQIFGLPFRLANYDPNAPQAVVDQLCNMLQNMGHAGWGAFPTGTEIKFQEAGGKAAASPQADLLDRADKNASLLVLGQTLTGDTSKNGGSLALGQVHEGVKGEIVQAAGRYVAEVLTTQLFPSVLRLNYGEESECPTAKFVSEEKEDLQATATTLKLLKEAGAGSVIGLDWVSKKFNIPKPAPDEATLDTVTPTQTETEGEELTEEDSRKDATAQTEEAEEDSHEGTKGTKEEVAARDAAARLAALLAIPDDAAFDAALKAHAATL